MFVLVVASGCQKDAPDGSPPSRAPAATAVETKEPPVDSKETVRMKPVPPAAAPTPVTVDGDFAAVWDTPIATLAGEPTTLGAFKGKALLVVNVASKCGLTPQYEQLEQLQDTYAAKGFTVVGFPCNQFGGQEPGSAEEIAEFCSATYGVSFPMMEKVEVNGAGRHPIYQRLTPIADASGHAGDIRWNFEKFVISADGTKVTRFEPRTKPDDPAVIAAIEAALP